MKSKRDPEFVEIRAFDNYIYAHIVLARLQDADIICHLKDEFTITIDPLLSPALGGIKLMVATAQVDRALELLAEPEG
jgi:putative signal transducing protein